MPDLQELIANGDPIYVLNRTGRYLEKQGPYILEFKEGGKRAHTVIVPATKFPFLLSGHVPPNLLAQSTELYAAFTKGILELMEPDAAQAEMEDPVAQKVVANAMRKFQPTTRKAKAPPELIGTDDRTNRIPPGADKGISGIPETRSQLRVAESESGVNPTVEQIVMDLKSDPTLREEKYLELAGMEGLTQDDYGHVMVNLKKHKQILQWARTSLADMIGEDGVAAVEADHFMEDEDEVGAPTRHINSRSRRGRKK